MKILHINTSLNGGAAIAAKRIHQGLVDSGVDSSMFYNSGLSTNPSYFEWTSIRPNRIVDKVKRNLFSLYCSWRMQRNLSRFISERPDGFELFSQVRLGKKIQFKDLPVRPDILHLHWIAGFFDYETFFESIPNDLPIVWTLHDMNAFTGGCHYSWGCEGYKKKCGNCPQLAHASNGDLSRQIIEEKLRLLSDKLIHVVADSRWIEAQARQSSLFHKAASVRTIHYGLDVDTLTPRDKLACRQALQIPKDYKVIVFGADDVENKRKGLAELVAALNIVRQKDKNIFLLTFGTNSGLSKNYGKMSKHLGFVSSLDMLSMIYSSADVFVMASLYEAFGQVALEAMSCGVPVVSFDNGGASDIVVDGITGLLAKKGDLTDLADKLVNILSDFEKCKDMGMNARDMVLRQFTSSHQAANYKILYKEVGL